MEVQTRSDSHTGLYSGSNYFLSVKEAYKAHKMDKNISKLTFDDKEGNHRYKLKLKKSLYFSQFTEAIVREVTVWSGHRQPLFERIVLRH